MLEDCVDAALRCAIEQEVRGLPSDGQLFASRLSRPHVREKQTDVCLCKIDLPNVCYHVFSGHHFPEDIATSHDTDAPTSLDNRLTRRRRLNKLLVILTGHVWGQIRDSPAGTSRTFKVFPGTKRGQ